MIHAPWRPAHAGRARIALVVGAIALAVACGKKGPPLPPLIRVPAPPSDLTAVRRGAEVDLQFTVPSANTDGTRPANVERVDVYAFTGSATVADDQLLKLATKVGSVPVKAPRDPNVTVEPDESSDDIEPPEGRGFDQGATARIEERLTQASLLPLDIPRKGTKPVVADPAPRPLLGPPAGPPIRTYVIVGLTKRGRKGPLSQRVSVPLVAPPPPPLQPKIDYDEATITLTWSPPAPTGLAPPDEGVLPSRPIGVAEPKIAYNVYEATPAADGASRVETRLTKSPVAEPKFTDSRIVWGAERCYVVRTVQILGSLALESDAPPPACSKLVDTFPPAAPKDLQVVAGEGSISLIWRPNNEKDLAGYIVLRGVAPGDKLDRITPAPIRETMFKDAVSAGVQYFYAVQAVDKAGNVSPKSNLVDETARE